MLKEPRYVNVSGALRELADNGSARASGPQGPDFKAPVRHVIYMVERNVEHASVGGEVGDPQRTIPALLNAMQQWQAALKPLLRQAQKKGTHNGQTGG